MCGAQQSDCNAQFLDSRVTGARAKNSHRINDLHQRFTFYAELMRRKRSKPLPDDRDCE
jgi:hypothetical protein